MAVIRIVPTIAAPIDRCFDLARDIEFHTRSPAATGERAVAGRITGLIGVGESVTWEAQHLGVRQRFTAAVTVLERPVSFRDVMTAGEPLSWGSRGAATWHWSRTTQAADYRPWLAARPSADAVSRRPD
jgi:hypothetical protein